jgi:predicted nuclease of predicted toxin-antitoxin system
MKLLFDQNLSFRLCGMLADLYPDSRQARLIGLDRAGDQDIWQHARANNFVIVTQDSDYADMSALYGSPPKVIWLRCGNQPTATIERLLRGHAAEIAALDANNELSCLELF